MFQIRPLPVLAPCLALFLCLACFPALAAGARSAEALESRQAEFFAAIAGRDAAALAALFAEDGVLQVAGMPAVEGRADIESFYRRLFGFLAESRVEPGRTRVSGDGSMGYSIGHSVNAFDRPDGRVEYAGKFTLVWVRADDGWQVAVYSISSDQQEGGR